MSWPSYHSVTLTFAGCSCSGLKRPADHLFGFSCFFPGFCTEIFLSFLYKLRLTQGKLSLGGLSMTERKQKVTQRRKPGRIVTLEALRQTCWVVLQGCGSLLSSTLLPAEIAAPVTQIHTGKCAALKPKTHDGAVCEWNYNAEPA